jgi:hypothetical protein
MALELQKNVKDIILVFKEIQPCKTTIAINETDIICVSTNKWLGRTLYIQTNNFKRCRNCITNHIFYLQV